MRALKYLTLAVLLAVLIGAIIWSVRQKKIEQKDLSDGRQSIKDRLLKDVTGTTIYSWQFCVAFAVAAIGGAAILRELLQ